MVGEMLVLPHRRGVSCPTDHMKHFLEIRSYNLIPGTREAILDCIENYTELVVELDEVTLQGLRKGAT